MSMFELSQKFYIYIHFYITDHHHFIPSEKLYRVILTWICNLQEDFLDPATTFSE